MWIPRQGIAIIKFDMYKLEIFMKLKRDKRYVEKTTSRTELKSIKVMKKNNNTLYL